MMCIIVAKARSICKFVLESEINNYTRKSSIKLTPGESQPECFRLRENDAREVEKADTKIKQGQTATAPPFPRS